ncbi:MAG: polyprenol monophosphomannose synthase [Gemmatimonadales bacterium]|nr:MAG: polyprenol monophosphomannose synthase [Gemmatimonadales bacterium]
MTSDTTLVVVPTYNERESLPRVLKRLMALDTEAEGLGSVHALVVDDGSPDGTGELAEEWASEHPGRIHVLHREEKRGLGQAYVAGFLWGLEREYARICEMDADLSHPPGRLPDFIEAAREVDFVIGSRYVGGRVTVVNWPVGRLLISLFGSLYARMITRLPVSDATGGYNLFRREVLEGIELDRIQSNGYSFQIELKYRAWRKGFSFQEIPIVFTERDQGESKMSKAIVVEAVWKVWKLRFLDLFGRL